MEDLAREALELAVLRGRPWPLGELVKSSSSTSNDGLLIEELTLSTDKSKQGARVPIRLVKASHAQPRLPAVVLLHGTGHDMRQVAGLQERYARLGYLAVAMDLRYHGLRAGPGRTYQEAMLAAWKGELDERPFLLDSTYDLLGLMGYLAAARPDVDPRRIGLTGGWVGTQPASRAAHETFSLGNLAGISLGGMHTWLAAALDSRVAAAAPLIGIQGWDWAIRQRQYQGRVSSIPQFFEGCRALLGEQEVTPKVVEAAWHRLLPGLLGETGSTPWDCPQTLPLIAPRPLLVLNGAEDPRCPIDGLREIEQATASRYRALGVPDRFELEAIPGLGHRVTREMEDRVETFFNRHLLSK